jgi:hypothetical protein
MKKLACSIIVIFAFLSSYTVKAQATQKQTISAATKSVNSKDKKTAVKKATSVLGVSSKKTVTTTKKKIDPPKKTENNAPKLGVMNKKEK